MADVVNVGTTANDGNGDTLRSAFSQINARFNTIAGTLTGGDAWAAGVSYTSTPVRNWVVNAGQAYVAASNHVSGATFAADLAAGKWLAVDVAQLIADLAASSGSSLVGYMPAGVGAVARTVEGKLRDSVSVEDYGAIGDGITDDTVAIQAAINAMVATGGNLHFPRKHYAVRQISVVNTAYNFSMSCDGAIFYGIATIPTTAVIDICNAVDFDMLGKWRVVASSHYTAGLKIRAQEGGAQATTRVNIYNVTVRNALQAIHIGDYNVDYQCSEINIFGLNSFLCPVCVYLGGSQTVASFNGCNLVSEPNGAYPGAIEAVVIQEGGVVEVIGGEFVIAASTTGRGIQFNPASSSLYGNPYGMIKLSGALTEVSSQFLQLLNTRGLASPKSNQSQVLISGAGGYASPGIGAEDYFFVGDASYEGVIDINTSNFYSTSPRTGYNVSSASTLVAIKCDKRSFGNNFRNWIGGIYGGVLMHDLQPVVNASGIGTVIPAAPTPLKFINSVTSASLGRYSSGYNVGSGVYTATHNFTRLVVAVNIVGTVTAGDLYLKKNGAIVAFGTWNGIGKLDATLWGIVTGDTIEVVLQAAAPTTFDSGIYQSLQISGATE